MNEHEATRSNADEDLDACGEVVSKRDEHERTRANADEDLDACGDEAS